MPFQTSTDLMGEFRLEWEHALNPCASCLLARCEPGEREALSALLDDYLLNAPTPGYSPLQYRGLEAKVQPILDRVQNHPATLAAEDQRAAEWRDLPWLTKRRRRLRFRLFQRRLLRQARRRPPPWE